MACAATAEDALRETEGLAVRVDGAVAFHHECVMRNPTRMSSDAVSRGFRSVVSTWGTEGLRDARDAGEEEKTTRFALVECAEGYVFGLVTYAPSRVNDRAVEWARKPRHFSAGTRAELALACVNVATAHDVESFDAVHGDAVVIDPCCG